MKIPRSLIEQVKAHGKRTYPEECCGILLGKVNSNEKLVSEIIEVENAREEERDHRFLIPPQTYVEVDKDARSRGFEIVGFYHSHPDNPARPSDYDLEYAWAWFSYLIVRVEKGEPKEATAWVLQEDRSGFEGEILEAID